MGGPSRKGERKPLPDILHETSLKDGRLQLTVHLADPLAGDLNFILVSHRRLASEWCASFPPVVEGDLLVGEIAVDPGWGPVLELQSIKAVATNPTQAAELVGGRDFARLLIGIAGDGGGGLLLGDEAAKALDQVVEERRAVYSQPIGDGDHRFRAIVLAEGVLLHQDIRVPGLHVIRVENSTRGSDLEAIANAAALQLGLQGRIQPGAWVQENRSRRPTLVLSAPDIRATDIDAGARLALEAATSLLAVLSLQRDAPGTLLAAVIESVDTEPHQGRTWNGIPHYGGNLLGGIISGESQELVLSRYDRLEQESRLQLWLSLYRDALDEMRWDFGVLPFGAQVALTEGRRLKPDSSWKQIQVLRRLAFFYTGPVILDPGGDGFVVSLDGRRAGPWRLQPIWWRIRQT